MRLPLVLTAAALALSGCVVQDPNMARPVPPVVTPALPSADAVARTAARTAINQEMARRLPGANVAPYTDCVVNNASAAELIDIGRQVNQGGNVGNSVAAIVGRPATTQCIAGAAASARAIT